jgi:hypothetical protein
MLQQSYIILDKYKSKRDIHINKMKNYKIKDYNSKVSSVVNFGSGVNITQLTQSVPKQALLNNINYKKTIKGFIGHPVNSDTLLHYSSKSIIYSFKKNNNINLLLTRTEYLLKSFFLSMYSLISKPVYLITHDKVIIRLFVFLSPKVDRYLDTSPIVKEGKLLGVSPTVFSTKKSKGMLSKQINQILKFKQVRPKITEILKTQLLSYNTSISSSTSLSANSTCFAETLEKIIRKIIGHYSLEKGKKESYASLSLPITLGLKYAKVGCAVASAKQKRRLHKTEPNTPLPSGLNKNKTDTTTREVNSLQCETQQKVDVISNNNYYPYLSFSSTFKFKLEKLSETFRKIFKKEVEFEIIKAQLPFQDSNILAQILGYNANNYKFIKMLKILIPRAVIKNPSKDLSYITTNKPHKQASGFVDFTYPFTQKRGERSNLQSRPLGIGRAKLIATSLNELNFKVKDFNMLFSQPSSYLPPFFYSKYSMIANAKHPSSSLTDPKVGLDHLLSAKGSPELGLATGSLLTKGAESKGVLRDPTKLSYLSGMNIKLAGRLMTQSIRPRFTVQSKQEGSLARVKVHYTEKSRFTGKNKRGAFSFTVSISHVLS